MARPLQKNEEGKNQMRNRTKKSGRPEKGEKERSQRFHQGKYREFAAFFTEKIGA